MSENYREQIARLAQRAQEAALADQYNEAVRLDREMREDWENAVSCDNQGDDDGANFYAQQANAKAAEVQQKVALLQQCQPPQLSERKQRWMQRNPTLVNDPRFPAWADACHNYITGNMRVQDDSDAYEELMSFALKPGGDYQEDWTPDDVVKHLQEHSKVANLGGKYSGADYNRGVNQLINAKRNGYV
jgi:hypothetical protein